MAEIYLLKRVGGAAERKFLVGTKPLSEIAELFGVMSRKDVIPDNWLTVVVAVEQDEADGAEFEAGEYRATIDPHQAMRHCGAGFANLLGARFVQMG